MKRSDSAAHERLTASIYFDAPGFDPVVLDPLHAFLVSSLPAWSQELRVGKGEDDRHAAPVQGNDRLRDVIEAATPLRLGIGSTVLLGANDRLKMFLWASRTAKNLGQNRLTIEIRESERVEQLEGAEWLRHAVSQLALTLPIHYAKSHCAAEFTAKNMISDSEGTRAVGMRLRDFFPGLYWLNYFGPAETQRLGRERLLTAPTHMSSAVGNGTMLLLSASPLEWKTSEYAARTEAVLEHIGRDFFFVGPSRGKA